MIVDSEKTQRRIVGFIKSYAKDHGKTLLVLEMSDDNPASKALAELCLKTNIHTLAVVPENFKPDIRKLNVVVHRNADVTNYSFDLKVSSKIIPDNEASLRPWNEMVKYAIMSQVASTCNGIVVSSITKELLFGRTYQKGCLGDILPLADLYLQEVLELYPGIEGQWQGPEFTSQELEWACRENDTTHIIESSDDPTKHRDWGRFTLRQRQMVARLNQIEKLTRHKISNAPICELRNTPGLVR
jgi:hypothetical protein